MATNIPAGFPGFCVGIGITISGALDFLGAWIEGFPHVRLLFAVGLLAVGTSVIALAVLYGRDKDMKANHAPH